MSGPAEVVRGGLVVTMDGSVNHSDVVADQGLLFFKVSQAHSLAVMRYRGAPIPDFVVQNSQIIGRGCRVLIDFEAPPNAECAVTMRHGISELAHTS